MRLQVTITLRGKLAVFLDKGRIGNNDDWNVVVVVVVVIEKLVQAGIRCRDENDP